MGSGVEPAHNVNASTYRARTQSKSLQVHRGRSQWIAASHADNATDAMELFLNHPVDMVVVDNYLGDTTGVALAREMKRHKPQVPILLISGAIDRPEDSDVYDQFLSTLAGPQELLQSVDALLVRKIA